MFEEITYTLTEPEYAAALRATRRKAGKVRLIIQTGLLIILAAGFCIDFVWHRQGGSLFIGIVLAVLAVGQWVFPAVAFRREARALAAEAKPIHLTVSEEEIAAGGVTQKLSTCALTIIGDMVLWAVDRTQSVPIPRRAVPDTAWETLVAHAEG